MVLLGGYSFRNLKERDGNVMWDWLIEIILWLAESAVNLLPTYVPSNNGFIQSLMTALGAFNQWFPAVELVECMIAYLAFSGIYMVVKPILKFGRLS